MNDALGSCLLSVFDVIIRPRRAVWFTPFCIRFYRETIQKQDLLLKYTLPRFSLGSDGVFWIGLIFSITSRGFLLPLRIRDLGFDSEGSYCYRFDSLYLEILINIEIHSATVLSGLRWSFLDWFDFFDKFKRFSLAVKNPRSWFWLQSVLLLPVRLTVPHSAGLCNQRKRKGWLVRGPRELPGGCRVAK